MRLRSASINGGKPTRWSKSGHAAGLGHVPFTPKSDRLLRCREMTLCAMYGRRPRCKGKVGRLSEAFGCSHVFGLWMQPLWLLALM